MRCKCRRQAITSLRCSRCSVPICPDCSRVAPVGHLCRECASNKKSRLYQVSAGSLVLAFLACSAVAAFGGWLVVSAFRWGIFGILAAFIYGMGVAEVALRVTGRKRGLKMEILAGTCALLGIVVGLLLTSLRYAGPEGGGLYALFFDPWLYAQAIVAVFGAVNHTRNIM